MFETGWLCGLAAGCYQLRVTKFRKRWFWSWAIAGIVVPFAIAAVGHFVPSPPETGIFDPPPVLTVAQQRLEKASAITFPGQFVIGALALAVTDGGGDSGTPVAGTIILLVGLLANAAIYVVIGLAPLAVIEVGREIAGKRTQT
jgi:Ni/Fe-hydrogenase subunit HybB-like protein